MILKINNWYCKDNKRFVLQIWYWRSTTGTARTTRGLFYRYDTEDQQLELQGEQEVVPVVDLQNHICKTNHLFSLQLQLLIFSIISVKQTSCFPYSSSCWSSVSYLKIGLFYRYDTEDQQLELQGQQEVCFTDMILKINNWNCKDNKRFVLQIWYCLQYHICKTNLLFSLQFQFLIFSIISVKQTSCSPYSSSCWSSVSYL
jgi:hypothetical protein